MKKFVFRKLLILMPVLILAVSVVDASDKISPERRIHLFMLALDSGIIEKKDIAELKRLTKSKDSAISSRAIGLLAQYEGEGSGNLIKALTILTPYVLDKKEANAFKRKLIGGNENKEFLDAIPPANTWKFQKPELCVSMARILAFGKKYSEALAGFKRIGKNREGIPRILAAEGMGDMFFNLKRWEQSIGSYQFALQSIGCLKKLYRYEEMAPDIIIQALSSRIQKKLNAAKKEWDCEKYGPGYVAYRNARQKHFSGDYISAAICYDEIIRKFPKSVYCEAAGLYAPQCLLKLSEASQKKVVAKSIEKLNVNIEKTRGVLKQYGKVMTIRVRERFERDIAKDKELLKKLREVPTGKSAESKAVSDLKKFIESDKYGLYRGEAMLTLADFYMEKKYDVDLAFPYYKDCDRWLVEVKKLKKSLDAWKVPDKAKAVSAPPAEERKKDFWGNFKFQIPEAADIFNRRTSKWYCSNLHKKAIVRLGFIAYFNKEIENAQHFFERLYKVDPFFKYNESRNFGSVVSRMKWNIKHNRGAIFATPVEMKAFKSKNRRLAVMLADMYMEEEKHKEAANIYKMILAGKMGKISKNQGAYLTYALANCSVMISGRGKGKNEAIKILGKFDNVYRGSLTYPRALLTRGAWLTSDISYPKNIRNGIEDYKTIVRDYPRSKEAGFALHHWGAALELIKKNDEAEKVYKHYIKKYPEKGPFTSLVKKKLAKIAEKNNKRIKKKQGESNENKKI